MFRPEPRATLLYPSGPPRDPGKPHLFVLMTASSGPAQQVLMVPVSTRQSRSDTTCVIDAGAHEFIQHESVIEYRHARTEPAEKLIRGVANGEFVPKEPLGEQLFDRVRRGFDRSRFVKPFAREFLKDYG